MTRVKGGVVSKNRRRKVLKRAKGYFGSKHRLYKTAQEQLFHSGSYSFNDRKKRANDFRKLWITRINAACRNNDIVYSKFINGLKKANIEINRKMMSELAIFAPEEFTKLVNLSKDALEGKVPAKESKKVEEKVEKTVAEKTDYSKLTVAELKDLCAKNNIEVTSSMKKADLVAALSK
ncbi:MAG: 50S ribosomal protein L20 [Bacilli bacterium]|nr:50S ribosomal protein L20 [Bacilli bacterium]